MDRRAFFGSLATPLFGCGGASDDASRSGVMTSAGLPLPFTLFGPVPHDAAALSEVPPDDWWFPSNALSASVEEMRFDRYDVLNAKWIMVCAPRGHSCRLVLFFEDPHEVVEIARVTSAAPGRVPLDTWLPDGTLDAYRGGPYKYLGFQFKRGPSTEPFLLYKCKLMAEVMPRAIA